MEESSFAFGLLAPTLTDIRTHLSGIPVFTEILSENPPDLSQASRIRLRMLETPSLMDSTTTGFLASPG